MKEPLYKHLLPHYDVVKRVRLTFHSGRKTQTVAGCYYEQTLNAPEGARNPGPYRHRGIQVIGLISCYIKRIWVDKRRYGRPTVVTPHKVCFQLRGKVPPDMLGNEWYVAAYYVGEQTETQPFGSSTILGEWCGGGKIDDYETPYRRVLVDVEFIKE